LNSEVKRKINFLFLMRLIGLIIIVFILSRIDIHKTLQILKSIKLIPALVVTLTSVLMILLRAVRWQILMKGQGINIDFLAAVEIYAAGYFIGSITPGRVGEFSKAYYLKKVYPDSRWDAIASITVDRLLDVAFVLLTGICALIYLHFLSTITSILLLLTGITIFCLLGINKRIVSFILHSIFNFPPAKYILKKHSQVTEGITQGIISLTGRGLILPIFITVSIYTLYFLQAHILACALGFNTGTIEIGLALSCAMVLSMLPITIAGLGTREAGLIFFLGRIGMGAEEAVSFSLAIFLIYGVLLSLFCSYFHFKILKKTKIPNN